MFPNPNKVNRPILFSFISLMNPSVLSVMGFLTLSRIAQRRFMMAEQRRRANMLQNKAQADAAVASGATVPVV